MKIIITRFKYEIIGSIWKGTLISSLIDRVKKGGAVAHESCIPRLVGLRCKKYICFPKIFVLKGFSIIFVRVFGEVVICDWKFLDTRGAKQCAIYGVRKSLVESLSILSTHALIPSNQINQCNCEIIDWAGSLIRLGSMNQGRGRSNDAGDDGDDALDVA